MGKAIEVCRDLGNLLQQQAINGIQLSSPNATDQRRSINPTHGTYAILHNSPFFASSVVMDHGCNQQFGRRGRWLLKNKLLYEALAQT